MEHRIVEFKAVEQSTWDSWVSQLKGASYYHTWHWLRFIGQFHQIKNNLSFIIQDVAGKPLAVCPLAVSYLEREKVFSFSFNYHPCGAPVITSMPRSQRRELLNYIFSLIGKYQETYGCQQIIMAWHPLNSLVLDHATEVGNEDSFELMRYGLFYQVDNTLVIDLNLTKELLISNVGKYHYRHIQRGIKKGLRVEIYNNKHNPDGLRERFNEFHQAHYVAAGRETRPYATWEAMYEGLSAGKASLFIAFVNDTPISYLYCGEFSKMAFGWSQANVKEYEEEYSPRHLLEWTAILFYKENAFSYYEIGERFFGSQFFYIPSDKEISISSFKERYGGRLFPKVKWYGYFDKDLLKTDYNQRFRELLNCNLLVKIPEEK